MKQTHKVLIAEDSEFQAAVLEAVLANQGIDQVSIAANGMLALEIFKQALASGLPYPLVFLDIIMPEMDGQETLRRMRALEQEHNVADADKSVIIMTTALDSPRDMMDALLEGDCTDYIVKPVEERHLLAILRKYEFIP